MLKNLWSFAHKKDRLWFRWINDYYLKHSDVFSYIVPSITSWMLAKIFNSRRLVVNLQDQNDCAPHGHFSMKIAYKKLLGQHPKVPWRAIWYNNKTTPTSVVCMWQAILNRLHTIDRLWKWGMSWDPMCRLCNAAPETRDHLFGDCVFIRKVKAFVCSDFHWPTSFSQDVRIMNHLSKKKRNTKTLVITMSWAEIIYHVWFQRNVKIFGGKSMDEQQLGRMMIFNVAARLSDKQKQILLV